MHKYIIILNWGYGNQWQEYHYKFNHILERNKIIQFNFHVCFHKHMNSIIKISFIFILYMRHHIRQTTKPWFRDKTRFLKNCSK